MPSDNIDAALRKIEFKGTTSYTLCMERTLQHKPWMLSKAELMVDLLSIKEEDLLNYVLEREIYHLVPVQLLQLRPSSGKAHAHEEVGELHCMKNVEVKKDDIEQLWKGKISLVDEELTKPKRDTESRSSNSIDLDDDQLISVSSESREPSIRPMPAGPHPDQKAKN